MLGRAFDPMEVFDGDGAERDRRREPDEMSLFLGRLQEGRGPVRLQTRLENQAETHQVQRHGLNALSRGSLRVLNGIGIDGQAVERGQSRLSNAITVRNLDLAFAAAAP